MHLARKIELAAQAIRFISTADDTDSAVRKAALKSLAETIAAEAEAIDARVAERVKSEVEG